MSSAIACPTCGADGTNAANEVLTQEAASPSGARLSVAPRMDFPPVIPGPPLPGTPVPRSEARHFPPLVEFAGEQRRGRLILLCAFGPLLLVQMLGVGLIVALHLANPGKEIARMILHPLFMVGTYLGVPWAKRLLLITAVLGVVDSGGDLLTKPNWISAFVLLVITPIPAVLLFSKSVNAFLDYQERER